MQRVQLLYLLFFLVALGIFARIVYLQYSPVGKALRARVEERTFNMQRTDGHRGEIFAADGSLLATSVTMYYLGMDFGVDSLTAKRFDRGADALGDSLAALFGDKTAGEYRAFLRESYASKRYRRLNPRLISVDELRRVQTFPLLRERPGFGGLSLERVYNREHPFGGLAERTLGQTRTVYDTLLVPTRDSTVRRELMLTERGLYGLEFSFDSLLRGRHGWQMTQRQTRTFYTPVASPLNVEPSDGADVVTTLDMDFQDVAHDMLAQQLTRHNALYGTVILMEVATGHIKAMANLQRMDDGTCREVSNYAVGGRFEPGSTFKLATLLALLDDGMRLTDMVAVGNGTLELRGAKFRDDHVPENGYETLKRVFETSSNVGFVQAVEQRFVARGKQKDFVDYIAALGFDRPVGTGLVGEAAPVLHRPTPESQRKGTWHSNSASYMSHGYGLEVSPLHTLALYNAVAGDGRMVRPMLVTEIRKGADVERFDTEVINPRIAPARTISAVRESLEGVVDQGTGRVLQNPYYKVAAKTGTAQQLSNGRYLGGHTGQIYMATMVGYFPADDPRYSCLVSIWTRFNAFGDVFYGSNLAGPVFKAVADRVYVTHYEWQQPIMVND